MRWFICPWTSWCPTSAIQKKHPDEQIEQIAASISEFGDCDPIAIWHDDTGQPVIVEGHGRALALKKLGIKNAPTISLDHLSDDERRAYSHVHNQTTLSSGFDADLLELEMLELPEFDWAAFGFDEPEGDTGPMDGVIAPVIRDEFGEPPLTVLNSRSGEWRERKRRWWDAGLVSDEGRGEQLAYRNKEWAEKHLTGVAKSGSMASGTSVFDPVLCELLLAWYSEPGDHILDPFAGGATRGVVASMMGRSYIGVDLSAEQIEADRRIAEEMGVTPAPDWRVGDSAHIGDIAPGTYDMILTCPPYGPLESYDDGPGDLSTMGRAEFNVALASILTSAAGMLADDRFIAVVLGDYRDKDGGQWGIVSAFDEAMRRPVTDGGPGLTLVSHAILLNAVGTAAWRCRRPFLASRILTTVHQHVLIYRKGDRRRAVERLGEPDLATFADEPEEE